MSNSEQGIFQAQARAASEQLGGKHGWRELQQRNSIYLDERVIVYLLAIAMVGLFLVWVTWKSILVLYGSLALVIALLFIWGLFRLRGIEKLRREREMQVRYFAKSKAARNPGP